MERKKKRAKTQTLFFPFQMSNVMLFPTIRPGGPFRVVSVTGLAATVAAMLLP